MWNISVRIVIIAPYTDRHTTKIFNFLMRHLKLFDSYVLLKLLLDVVFSFAKLCLFIDKLLLSVYVFSTAIITVFSIVITIVVISTYAQLSLYITKKLRNHKVNHIHCGKISLTYYIYFYIFLSSIDWKKYQQMNFHLRTYSHELRSTFVDC